MEHKERFLKQVERLIRVYREVHLQFLRGQPVDQCLSQFFRSNKNFGSRDRKLVAGAIFGLYRWFGWLQLIEVEETSKALLLGYLLDLNPLNELVDCWAEEVKLPAEVVRAFETNQMSLQERADLLRPHLPSVDFRKLNPDFAPRMPLERMESLQNRPPLWVRLVEGEAKGFLPFLQSHQISYRLHPEYKGALEIISPVNLFDSKDFRMGNVEVQDISSQAVGHVCAPQPGQCWWDVCMGSGGKSLHLASLMKDQGRIYGTDIRPQILRESRRRIKKKGWKSIEALDWDGEALPAFERPPDAALVDAPCSCSGTWRRSPDIRWQLKVEHLKFYTKLQLKILTKAASALRSGGILVYSTCSIFEEENRGVVRRFLAANSSFVEEEFEHPFTAEPVQEGLNLLPPALDGNGMFVTRMRKK